MQEKEISKLEYWRNIKLGKLKKSWETRSIESFSNAIKSDNNRFNLILGNVY